MLAPGSSLIGPARLGPIDRRAGGSWCPTGARWSLCRGSSTIFTVARLLILILRVLPRLLVPPFLALCVFSLLPLLRVVLVTLCRCSRAALGLRPSLLLLWRLQLCLLGRALAQPRRGRPVLHGSRSRCQAWRILLFRLASLLGEPCARNLPPLVHPLKLSRAALRLLLFLLFGRTRLELAHHLHHDFVLCRLGQRRDPRVVNNDVDTRVGGCC